MSWLAISALSHPCRSSSTICCSRGPSRTVCSFIRLPPPKDPSPPTRGSNDRLYISKIGSTQNATLALCSVKLRFSKDLGSDQPLAQTSHDPSALPGAEPRHPCRRNGLIRKVPQFVSLGWHRSNNDGGAILRDSARDSKASIECVRGSSGKHLRRNFPDYRNLRHKLHAVMSHSSSKTPKSVSQV